MSNFGLNLHDCKTDRIETRQIYKEQNQKTSDLTTISINKQKFIRTSENFSIKIAKDNPKLNLHLPKVGDFNKQRLDYLTPRQTPRKQSENIFSDTKNESYSKKQTQTQRNWQSTTKTNLKDESHDEKSNKNDLILHQRKTKVQGAYINRRLKTSQKKNAGNDKRDFSLTMNDLSICKEKAEQCTSNQNDISIRDKDIYNAKSQNVSNATSRSKIGYIKNILPKMKFSPVNERRGKNIVDYELDGLQICSLFDRKNTTLTKANIESLNNSRKDKLGLEILQNDHEVDFPTSRYEYCNNSK